MTNLNGKIALVTGAAGNLGEAVARRLRDAGAKVALNARKRSELEKTFADWKVGEDVFFVTADLTDETAVQEMVAQTIEHFGRIDILANIAGAFTMGAPVHELETRTWEFMLNVNAKTAFFTSRAVATEMVKQGSGKIVNIGARAAEQRASAKMAPYIISKAAVIKLTESMANELKGSGINVNCILPGTIDTPENRESMPKADHDKWVAPEAIADALLFLVSDAARAVHGASLPVYGLS